MGITSLLTISSPKSDQSWFWPQGRFALAKVTRSVFSDRHTTQAPVIAQSYRLRTMVLLFIGLWQKQDYINKSNSAQWLSEAFSVQHHHSADEHLKQFVDCALLFSLSRISSAVEASCQAVLTSKGHHLLLPLRNETLLWWFSLLQKASFCFPTAPSDEPN